MPGISGGVDCNISIHAPTQGATHKTTLTQNFCFISIHAPTQGATIGRVIITSRLYISIHAPTQGATSRSPSFSDVSRISIHAPTQGATNLSAINGASVFNFNPRSHARSDLVINYGYQFIVIFQSTLPRKERRLQMFFWTSFNRFQSTLPRKERQ